MTDQDQTMQALKTYIRAELDGHAFYKAAAERTKDARGKKMFVSLAADEIGHARRLAAEYEQLRKGGGWMSLQQMASIADGLDIEQVSVFAQGQASVIPKIDAKTTDLEALSLGIEMEKASWEAYSKAASEASSAPAVEVFQFLMKEEQGHLDLLRSTYEYLAKTDSWFEELEKPIFEG
ncbi:MAG: ferritin family protein [Chloroflexi bacterium]|nr:ferritin family protein [Chloroflexota bacterium]